MINREVTVLGSFRDCNKYPKTVDLLSVGDVHLEDIVDGVFDFKEPETAMAVSHRPISSIPSSQYSVRRANKLRVAIQTAWKPLCGSNGSVAVSCQLAAPLRRNRAMFLYPSNLIKTWYHDRRE